jgi:hypothetical protein
MNGALAALKEEDLEPLVHRVLVHDVRAWKELWSALEPTIEAIARRRRVTSRLCDQVDERRDIVVRVMEAFQEDGFRRLEELLACLRQRDGSFRPWLSAVARNAAINHTYAHPQQVGGRGAFCWAKHAEVPIDLDDARPDPFQGVVVSEILAYAERHLRPKQLEALLLWLSGEDRAEIAGALRLRSPDGAKRLVDAAVKRLRRRFLSAEEVDLARDKTIFSGARPRSPQNPV